MRILALLAALSLGSPAGATSDVVAWVGGTLVDGTGRDPVPDAVVVARGGRIVAAGPRSRVNLPRRAQVVDTTGRWMVPGLVDAHVHFFQSGGLYTRPDAQDLTHVRPYAEDQAYLRATLDETLHRYTASGITSVVDMGGPFWNFEVRERARNLPGAPHVYVAGPLISTVFRPQLDLGDPPIVKAAGPDEARTLARAQLEHRPDLLKVWFILDPKRIEESLDEGGALVAAVCGEAKRAGVPCAVHATERETARRALQNGADILVHGVDDALLDEGFLALFGPRHVYQTTLVVWEGYAEVLGQQGTLTDVERRFGDPGIVGSWAEFAPDAEAERRSAARVERYRERTPTLHQNLRTVVGKGVVVAAGTDAGNIGTLHGPALHREFELMADAGLTPLQVLLAATRDAARTVSQTPDFGTLEPGRRADLLVLEADPLADVRNLRRIDTVVVGGRSFSPDALVPPGPPEVIDRQIRAYNDRDLERFLSFYADDVILYRLPSGEVTAQGKVAMKEIYGRLFDQSPTLHCRVIDRTASGDFVTDLEFVTGSRGRPPVRAVAISEVRDGLIRRVWFLPKEASPATP
ncbi:MAG: amidohydrolase family protein [Deltaproteobacteria bacterium]|nr:amidohydrolase family protein [Deltaproteobacteria bacterium]